jgi:hypothetical protein
MVPQTGVVVWQLRGWVEDVVCRVMERSHAFTLTVERAGERLADEPYSTLEAALTRARELRGSLVRIGFAPVAAFAAEPKPVLDALLRHFARQGTAMLHLGHRA